MTIARVIIYGGFLFGFYYSCSRLEKAIHPPAPPSFKDKSLPIAKTGIEYLGLTFYVIYPVALDSIEPENQEKALTGRALIV